MVEISGSSPVVSMVKSAGSGDEALADYLRGASSDEPFEAWFGEPGIGGRFGYNADFDGFNHDRRLATVGQLLDLLLQQRGHEAPYSMYAGGIPVRKHLPRLLPDIDVPLLDKIYETYSFKVIPQIGEWVTKDRDSYQYLVESIRRFPDMPAFRRMIEAAGFTQTRVEPILGGLVAIHSGWKA